MIPRFLSTSIPRGVVRSVWTMALIMEVRTVAIGSVVGVGRNGAGQVTVPVIQGEATAVACGRDFSLALSLDGRLTGWGLNGEGRATPPKGLSGVVAVSAGIYHALALKGDGTVVGWGYAGNELLSLPASVTNVLAVAAGGYHSLALRRDGTVVGWGFHGNGRTTPPPTLTDVVAIDAGRDHSVALKSDGTVVAWGLNDEGQTDVPAGLTGVIAIAAGENHTLALKQDGTVVAWGHNGSLQSSVPAGLASVTAIAAGSAHSLALKSDGSLVGWGDNTYGQLNLAGSDLRAIAARGAHSLAIRGGGPVIATQPLSRTVLAGDSVSFSAHAGSSGSAGGVSYQWYFNGMVLEGATASTLNLGGVSKQQAGIYSVRVSSGSGVQQSANAVLVVRGLQQLAAPEAMPGGGLRLTFGDQNGDAISAPNATRYRVEASADLVHWSPIALDPVLVEGRLVLELPSASNAANHFFRVMEK